MSWKSFLSVGLLCVLATPALAVPALSVDITGDASVALDANGNWVWRIGIDPVTLVDTDGAGPGVASTPMAAELGFRETSSSNILNVVKNAVQWDRDNPGGSNANQLLIFGWEQTTDVDPGAGVNNRPVGVQANCTGCTVPGGVVVSGSADEVFSALGSIDFTSTGVKNYLTITVQGPVATSATSSAALRTTSLDVLGSYGAGNDQGRIAALNPDADFTQPSSGSNPHAINHNIYSGMFSRTATPGDANLTGGVSLADFSTVLDNFGIGTVWQDGNFKQTGVVSLGDFSTVLDAFGQPSGGSGAGLGGGSAVPEPATAALLALGILGCLGVASRRRR